MKKILAIILSAIMLTTMAIAVSAEPVTAGDKSVIVDFTQEGVAGLFNITPLNASNAVADANGLTIKTSAQGTEIGNALGATMFPTLVPANMPYIAVKYKSAGVSSFKVKFSRMPDDPSDPAGIWGEPMASDWSAQDKGVELELAASADYKVVIAKMNVDVVTMNPALFGIQVGDIAADLNIAEIGFFATEADAKTNYGIVDANTDEGTDTDAGSPSTSDAFAVSAVVLAAAAISAGVVLGKKKN